MKSNFFSAAQQARIVGRVVSQVLAPAVILQFQARARPPLPARRRKSLQMPNAAIMDVLVWALVLVTAAASMVGGMKSLIKACTH